MKLILDNIIFSIQKSGGISVVWYELINQLIKVQDIDLKFIEYLNSNENIFRKKVITNDRLNYNLDKWCELKRYFNPRIKEKDMFIFHSSYYRISKNKNAINITTIHDFTYELYRSGPRKWIHSLQKFSAIRRSDYIICVSENTKKDLLTLIPNINPNKIHVIYNGVSNEYFCLKDTHNFKFQNSEPYNYVLYIGLRDDYKRFDVAVKLAIELKKQLILIGGGNLNKNDKALLSEIEKNNCKYQHLTNTTNSELNKLYNYAFCLLYPSEYEGFGIPIIEAQRAGCPVVAYNSGATKEIAGYNPLLFDSYDIEKIAKNTENYLNDTTKRKQIVSDGINNAMQFSWKNTFQLTLDLYKKAFSEKIK